MHEDDEKVSCVSSEVDGVTEWNMGDCGKIRHNNREKD